ncbi:MAG: hypothetical protein ACKO68_05070 [Bacteroidota bacterium]
MKKSIPAKVVDLVEARQQAREHQTKEWDIKSWGKFNGFEVFTWVNPSREKLIATLDSMPSPIFWVSTEDVFYDQCSEYQNVFPNVKNVFILPTHTSCEGFLGDTQPIASFFEVFHKPELLQHKGIVVVTAKGTQGEHLINEFTSSLNPILKK